MQAGHTRRRAGWRGIYERRAETAAELLADEWPSQVATQQLRHHLDGANQTSAAVWVGHWRASCTTGRLGRSHPAPSRNRNSCSRHGRGRAHPMVNAGLCSVRRLTIIAVLPSSTPDVGLTYYRQMRSGPSPAGPACLPATVPYSS